MNKLQRQIQKASQSKFHLWVLNTILLRTVPFNKPHGLKVVSINEDTICIAAQNVKNNRNHIKGIHACALATLCEYVSGLSLLIKLDPKQYRIILKNISITYHYQAMSTTSVTFQLDQQEIEQQILQPLQTEEKIFREFTVEAYDIENHHICTGVINWQIKAWKNVKTK